MRHEWKPMTPFEFWLVVGTIFAVTTVAMIGAIMVHHE